MMKKVLCVDLDCLTKLYCITKMLYVDFNWCKLEIRVLLGLREATTKEASVRYYTDTFPMTHLLNSRHLFFFRGMCIPILFI